ncbi:hypothetical protein B0O80DRAFT_434472 [Mortierella sp. GBAus27b]|nr:hypothetical protein B0O80DRAFT_434472 [Mortierella sp. GBAus27b]
MIKTACSKALDIQELADHLASYLSPADLLVCVQVNRQWNDLFIPRLWHTIDDRLQSWEKILYNETGEPDDPFTSSRLSDFGSAEVTNGKDRSWFRQIFAKYGHHTRKLNIGWRITVDAASSSGVCTNLQDLEIDLQRSHGEPFYRSEGARISNTIKPIFRSMFQSPFHLDERSTFTQLYWGLVTANPGLQRLCLLEMPHLAPPIRSEEFIFKVLSGMKTLKDVCVLKYLSLSHVSKLHEAIPTLDTITLTGDNDQFEKRGSVVVPAIKSLALVPYQSHGYCNPLLPTIQDVIDILLLYSNLEQLGLIGIKRDGATKPVLASPAQGFALRKLQISDSTNLIPLLRYIPNLRELRVDGLSNETFRALTTYCKELEVLDWIRDPQFIDDDYQLDDDGLHQFLVSCRNLRVFNGIERTIKADDMIREPWMCQRLEKLRCRIIGIIRLTTMEETTFQGILKTNPELQDDKMRDFMPMLTDDEQDVVQKVKRSREQQRQVYRRLAGLQHLKHLDIGYENRDPWTWKVGTRYTSAVDGEEYLEYGGPTPHTLELSLESGLGQLEALKELKMFGFERVDHRLQKKDIEWMAKSWPNLKLMYGLAEDRLHDVEPDRNKAELRAHMQQLRPDVQHDSLFVDND